MNRIATAGRLARFFSISLLCLGSLQAAQTWFGALTGFAASTQLSQTLSRVSDANLKVHEIGVTPQGEWVIVAGDSAFSSPGFPAFALEKINQYLALGRTIDVVSFAPNGSWVVIAQDLYWRSAGLPQTALLAEQIEGRLNSGNRIQEVAFAPDGTGWSIISGNWTYSESMPLKLREAIFDRRASKRKIQGITTAGPNKWAFYADQWTVTNSAPASLISTLRSMSEDAVSIDHVRLGPQNSYLVYSNGKVAVVVGDLPKQLEYSLQNGGNIYRRMSQLNVRGVSIAIIDNNEVVAARGYGLREWGTEKPVLAKTPFDTASLTKFITASTAMRMAEQNLITLATDLRSLASQNVPGSHLNLWKSFGETVPNLFGIPPGVTIPQGMTLRRLLSHTAGAADVGPVGIGVSEWPGFLPPLWQRLLGLDCGANGCYFDKTNIAWYDPNLGPPGTKSRYSNASLFLAQAMLERAAGNVAFTQLVKQYVLDPLGMEDSRIVAEPQSAAWEHDAAQMHSSAGEPLERRIYIWSGSGGLYASAKDYARAMIPLMNGGKTQEGADYLHPFSVFLMLQTVPPNPDYSLGLNLSQAIVTPQGGTFSHNGSHPNRARAEMMGRPDRKQGFVVLVNGGGAGPAAIITELNEAFKQVYGW